MALYSFAGLCVDMEPRYSLLLHRAAPYLLSSPSGKPDIRLRVPSGPWEGEAPGLSEEDLENAYLCGLFYRALLGFDGMMLHASAVAYGGFAYLFSAPSGTGKSTHTAGWVRLLGKEAVILNDDKPALRVMPDGRFYACGTPFSGTSPLNANLCLPVGGICRLYRGEENSISPLSPAQALPLLYEQTVNRLPDRLSRSLLSLLDKLVDEVPLWKMTCTVGDAAVRLSFETMTGKPFPV